MCGIFGMAFCRGSILSREQENWVKDFLMNLAIRSQKRGSHATGLAVFNGKSNLYLAKNHLPAVDFIKTDQFINTVDQIGNTTNIILGHTRYATKGDVANNNNNHPIISKRFVGTHNGHISNDDELFKSLKLPRKGQVDSEIIFRMLDTIYNKNSIQNMSKIFNQLRGTYALAFVNRTMSNTLYLARHINPIELAYFPQINTLVYASEVDFIKQALTETNNMYDNFKIGRVLFKTLSDNHMIIIDTATKIDFDKIKEHRFEPGGYYSATTTHNNYSSLYGQNRKDEVMDAVKILGDDLVEMWESAYKRGKEEGFNEGFKAGYQECYEEIIAEEHIESYEQGFRAGEEKGINIGYQQAIKDLGFNLRKNPELFAKLFKSLTPDDCTEVV